MQLSEVKKGDHIRIEHGFINVTAKVHQNKPNRKIILLYIKKFKWLGVRKYRYSDYHFNNFEEINKINI